MDLAYDGTGFHGYATQPNVPTVQAALEDAMEPWVGEVDTSVAGRTDKGVHATGQVVSFETTAEVDTFRLMRSLNRRLGPAIAVLSFSAVGDDFHARHSATGRRYRYQVLNREAPDPFLARTSWHLTASLDVEEMNRAIGPLVGVHDFAAFCKKAKGRGTVRELRSLEWKPQPGDLVVLDVHASSFCHQMVRSIVAASVDVGRGVIGAVRVAEILDTHDRTQGRGAAPSRGLTLVGVDYD
jgi:tRNA pseudouridine38-40 synthase